MESAPSPLVRAFCAGSLHPVSFGHGEHVRVAWELSRAYAFDEAGARLCRGFRQLAAEAGHPQKFHTTLTLGYLALIAERRATSWGDLVEHHADLFAWQPNLLEAHYAPGRLWSDAARQRLVLPDRTPSPAEVAALRQVGKVRAQAAADVPALLARAGV